MMIPRSCPPDEATLREVIARLAPIPRLPTSDGEREAAELLAEMLRLRGCETRIEDEPAYRSYAWPIGVLCALGAVSALVAGSARGRSRLGRRLLGVVGGAVAAYGIADYITGTRLLCRRTMMRTGTAANVVAQTGDPDADRTLVVLAHHDAAPSGVVFDQRVSRWVAERHPDVVEAMTSNPPLWWPVVAGPAMVSAGSLLGSAWLRRAGLLASLGSLAAMVDIGRRPPVPGANDNLSGVAVLVALAEALRARPVRGLRVLLVSAGAEEALQEGIRGWAARHFPRLPTRSTWFVNVDTVGSGRLVLLEGEGPLRMRDYDGDFKDLVDGCARAEGVDLLRGLRSHNSTDSAVPNRFGYPVATLVSVDGSKLIPHYHLDSDEPQHVDIECVAKAVRVVESVARTLAETANSSGRDAITQ
jgi:hypothetical protein